MISLLALHGLIHLLGAFKGLQWAEIPALTLPISRLKGIFWLITFLLFLASALRYYHRPAGATLEEWEIKAEPESEQVFQGMRIPTRFSVTWKLEEGDFHWLNLEITDIAYGLE